MFNIFYQNMDSWYTLEPPQRGGSNEYQQCMFWIKNKKNRYTPANPFFYIKGGVKVFIARTFPDEKKGFVSSVGHYFNDGRSLIFNLFGDLKHMIRNVIAVICQTVRFIRDSKLYLQPLN